MSVEFPPISPGLGNAVKFTWGPNLGKIWVGFSGEPRVAKVDMLDGANFSGGESSTRKTERERDKQRAVRRWKEKLQKISDPYSSKAYSFVKGMLQPGVYALRDQPGGVCLSPALSWGVVEKL